MLEGINFFAVAACIISSWLLGGLWYSKFLFGKMWCGDANLNKKQDRHPAIVFVIAFVLWTITAVAFASALGPNAPFQFATFIGLLTGSCFVATSFGVNYAFAGRSFKVFLIDGGYHILQFVLYGMILGAWHQYM